MCNECAQIPVVGPESSQHCPGCGAEWDLKVVDLPDRVTYVCGSKMLRDSGSLVHWDDGEGSLFPGPSYQCLMATMLKLREALAVERQAASSIGCALLSTGEIAAGTESTADAVKQLVKKFEVLKAVMTLIDQLRAEEGDSVTIFADNPEFGGPECCVHVNGSWSNHIDCQVFGLSLRGALETAYKHRQSVSKPKPNGLGEA